MRSSVDKEAAEALWTAYVYNLNHLVIFSRIFFFFFTLGYYLLCECISMPQKNLSPNIPDKCVRKLQQNRPKKRDQNIACKLIFSCETIYQFLTNFNHLPASVSHRWLVNEIFQFSYRYHASSLRRYEKWAQPFKHNKFERYRLFCAIYVH